MLPAETYASSAMRTQASPQFCFCGCWLFAQFCRAVYHFRRGTVRFLHSDSLSCPLPPPPFSRTKNGGGAITHGPPPPISGSEMEGPQGGIPPPPPISGSEMEGPQGGRPPRPLISGSEMGGPQGDRKSTRLNSSHVVRSRMPSSA